MIRAAFPVIVLVLGVGGCSDDATAPAQDRRDPVVAQALDDPLMTDPDLSSRNEGAAAITVRTDGPLPVLAASDQEVAAARAEAAALVGGEDKLARVPRASGSIPPLTSHDPSDHLAVLADKTDCRADLSDSTVWAARLPAALPVYPRGATLAATGGDGKGCRVVAVVFATPVPIDAVLAFYWQRAAAAGMAPVHLTAGGWSVLQGRRAGTAFDLRAQRANGQTTVELATVTG